MASSPSDPPKGNGHPVQILDFDFTTVDNKRTSSLTLNSEKLNEILAKAGDRNVALISIVGPSRQGKSFLLGFLLRYLESLNTDEIDWFGYENPDKPLDGFKWRTGIDPETTGMWIWSEPFFVKLGDGKECAVLLMDTQGTYDENTTQREWSRIVGLSLLTSSCLIFNFFHNLQEDTLSSLGAFMDYGMMAAGDSNTCPFQKLIFLIRDWNMPGEFPYGAKGGKAFLARKFEEKPEQADEAKRIRRSIESCFEHLSCFLMPDPGDKMKAQNFDGSIQGFSPKFSKNLEAFVSDLLDPENLQLKQIGGCPVKAVDLALFFGKYVQIFNSEEVMEPLSIFEATSQIINANLVSNAKEMYRKSVQAALRRQSFLSDQDLLKCHQKSCEKAIQHFDISKKSGNESSIAQFKEQLIEDLDKDFKEHKFQNSEKKMKIFQKSRDDSIQKYIEKMKLDLGDSFMNSNELKATSGSYKLESVTTYSEECSSEDPEILNKEISNLVGLLDHEEELIMTLNENRMLDAEKTIREIIKQAVDLYLEEMNAVLNELQYLPELDFSTESTLKTDAALAHYSAAEKPGDKSFQKKFEIELKKELESSVSSIQVENENRKIKLEAEAAKVTHEMVQTYEERMNLILENVHTKENLKDEHDTCMKEIISLFLQVEKLPRSILEAKIPEFESLLGKSFVSIERQFILNSRNLEEECENACGDAIAEFDKEMNSILGSRAYIRSEDFLAEFKSLTEHVIEETMDVLEKIEIPKEEFEKHLNILKGKLEASFEKWEEHNNFKQEHAAAKAQNDANDSVAKYQSEVKQAMDNCRTESDLNQIHTQIKEVVIQEFEAKYSGVHPSFLEKYQESLEAEIDEKFKELQELFLLKKEESEAGTKTALAEAKKFYEDEFSKYFQNTDFRSPIQLEVLHKEVTKIAIERCQKNMTQNLTEIQRQDLVAGMDQVYLKYKELNNMNMPTNPAIGIDLGTTFCCVAVYAKGDVKIIENYGKKTTPSYVAFNNTGEVVGEAAKNQAHENPENTIYDAKRIIGRKFDDPDIQKDMKLWPFTVVEESQVPKILACGKTYHPEQISAKLLKEMKKAAEEYLGCEVTNAVITVPAYFNDGQRQATVDAGTLAGLNVLKILNEPTAAAIAYNLQHKDLEPRNVLIFDLGGGTFDVAVLEMTPGKIEVKAVDGDTHLGGEDFDNNIVQYAALEFQSQYGIDLMEGKKSKVDQEKRAAWRVLRRLKTQCEDRKVDLSSSKKVTIAVDAIQDGIDLSVTLSREKFEDMNIALFEKTIRIVENALISANVNKNDIQDIVVVGGSTRIPKVQQLLSDFFNGKALNKSINPDEAVAHGAAVQAAIMNGEIAKESIDFTKIQDVTPMSLGVEIIGNRFSRIIKKNTKIPVTLSKNYITVSDNQTGMRQTIYQGEDKVASNNDKLGEFTLEGIPPAPAGHEGAKVTMEITEQGILHVTAVCCSTGGTKDLTITEYKNRLSKSAIQKLLAEGSAAA